MNERALLFILIFIFSIIWIYSLVVNPPITTYERLSPEQTIKNERMIF